MPEPLPEYAGCYWPMDPACRTADWEALDDDTQDRALAIASASLVRLTGGRVGACPVRVRPVPSQGSCYVYNNWFTSDTQPLHPVLWQGQWRNCGAPTQGCEVRLPAPVTQLQEVWIDGDEQDYDDYRIDNGDTLVYQGTGECPFPATQNLNLDHTNPGTFEVVYLNTYPVDSIGAHAVGVLALEFAKACSGKKCALPPGTTSVTRQGVSIEIVAGSFPGGFTGLQVVDAFIALWNPRGLIQPPTVWTPTQRPRQNTAAGLPSPSQDWHGGTA